MTASASTTAAPAGTELAIDLRNVEKTYRGRVRALRGIEMQVHRGAVFGLLGPNGAGKSTLVKIMMTVIRPTKAEGTVLGRPVGHRGTLARVGFLPEHHRLPQYLTGRQVLEHYAALAKVPRRERRQRAGALLDTVGMTAWAGKRIRQYSKGMMQRIGLAQALMNDPDLIVLDEPTDGVDPVGRREIRDVLVRMKHEGRTVFLNSHLLSELEMVCDRVAILVQGVVAQQGTLDELTRDSVRYEIDIAGAAPDWAAAAELRTAEVPPPPMAPPGTPPRSRLVMQGHDAERLQPVLDRLRSEQRIVVAVRPVRESLEDLFMRAVQDPATGGTLAPGAAPTPRRKAAAPEAKQP